MSSTVDHKPPARVPAPIDVLRILRREARRRLGKLAVCAAIAALVFLVPLDLLDLAQRRTAFIFVLAAGLWITEAIPLYATSLLVIGLEIVLLALPEATPGLAGPNSYETFLAAAADPILALFFGGFVLARAVTRYKLDIALARVMLKPFGTRPAAVLAGVMGITALFAMWMSATASTTMMLAVLAPLLAHMESGDPFRRALVLGVPFAASIGGIGTPIGSPPNAVALAVLRNAGEKLTVLQWLQVGVPLMLLLLCVCWVLLRWAFPPRTQRLDFRLPADFRLPLTAYVVAAVFAVTVLLWLTSELHGIPPGVVALFPAVVFTALCILDTEDVNTLEWNALILIAGGISLGIAMRVTGLDARVVHALPLEGVPPYLVVAGFAAIGVGLASVMSHTAAANLILPVVVSLQVPGVPVVWVGIVTALACALGIALPISTPPNALAYATGEISAKDMLRVGGAISVLGILLIVVTGRAVLRMWGLI